MDNRRSVVNSLRSEPYAAALVAAFVILGLVYSMTVPLWEAPDEPAHFAYVKHLVEMRSLPVQRTGVLDAAHHPPLYYVVAAIFSSLADFDDPTGSLRPNPEFVWAAPGNHQHNAGLHGTLETFPFRGIALAAHLARLVSVGCGALTVALTYALARQVFPEDQKKGLALLAAGLVALNPQFLFITSSVSIDGMAAMTCTLALCLLIWALQDPSFRGRWVLTGIGCGLAVLAKSNSFTVGLTAGVMLAACAVHRRSLDLLWRCGSALVAAFLFTTGWWFVRNQVLYGDPLGWQTFITNWATVLRDGPVRWSTVRRFFTVQFRSYWGQFGWMTITMDDWVYRAILAVCVLSVIGWGAWLWRQRSSFELRTRRGLATLVLLTLVQEGFQLRSIFTFDASWYQGRYLFPAIAALSILLAAGLWHLMSGRVARSSLAALVGVGLLSLAVAVPFCVIRPRYPTPTVPKWLVWRLPWRANVSFDDQIRLLGYEVAELPDRSAATITLYWEAVKNPELDYSVFLHGVDESGQMVVQSDVGLGSDQNYPSSAWWPGDIVATDHVVILPSETRNRVHEIRIGVYFAASGRRLPAADHGVAIGDSIVLDRSVLR